MHAAHGYAHTLARVSHAIAGTLGERRDAAKGDRRMVRPANQRSKTMANLTIRVNALGTKNAAGEDNKGTISLVGLNARFPLSLYANQWETLAKAMPAIIKEVRRAVEAKEASVERAKTTTSAKGVAISV